jgi:hypothetical protein
MGGRRSRGSGRFGRLFNGLRRIGGVGIDGAEGAENDRQQESRRQGQAEGFLEESQKEFLPSNQGALHSNKIPHFAGFVNRFFRIDAPWRENVPRAARIFRTSRNWSCKREARMV